MQDPCLVLPLLDIGNSSSLLQQTISLSYHRIIYFLNLHILAVNCTATLADFQGGFVKGQNAGRKCVGFKTRGIMRHILLLQGDEFNQ